MSPAVYLETQQRLLFAADVLSGLDLLAFSLAHDQQPLSEQTEQARVARRCARLALALKGEYIAALMAESAASTWREVLRMKERA